MSGLLFFGALALWCLVAALMAAGVVRVLPGGRWRVPAGLAVFACLLVLPVADELAGAREFSALCQANSTIEFDPARAAGRTVYPDYGAFAPVEGSALAVQVLSADYRDVETGESLVRYRLFEAQGGWLAEVLRFSETRVPLTFDGRCDPGGQGRLAALFQKHHITLTRRPKKAGK